MSKEEGALVHPMPGVRRPLDRRLLVRFASDQLAELAAMAETQAMSRGALVRHLVELGRQVMTRQATRDIELLALAALLASEQSLELLQQIVPEGRQRALLAKEAAVAAAQSRLGELRVQLARESTDG